MAVQRDPVESLSAVRARRSSRARRVVAVVLLAVVGLLTAASVLASRAYQPAPSPGPSHYRPATPSASNGPTPDHC